MLGLSGMSQYFDVAGTMVIVSFLYMLGPRGLFIELRGGASLLLVIMMLWTGKWHRRSQCLTGAEWMTFRFGDGPAGQIAQLARALIGMAMTLGLIAYLVKGIGLFLSMFLPFTPTTCALVMFTAGTLYTMVSGFYGVIFSDLFQGVLVIVAALVITFLAFVNLTDLDSIALLAEKVTQNSQWTEATPHLQTYMPPGYEAYESLLLFATIYVIRNLIFGLGVGDDPKYFGARSDAECSKLTLLWVCLLTIRWPMMIGIAVLGLSMINDVLPDPDVTRKSAEIVQRYVKTSDDQWPELISDIVNSTDAQPEPMITELESTLGENWQEKLLLVGYQGTVNPERIMPGVLLHYFPAGLRGIMLIAAIAASMSTFDSMVNSTAGLFVRDIYQKHLRHSASVRELIIATWVFILVLVATSFLFALTVRSINEIWVWFIMVLGGGLVAPLVLRLYWWRFNGYGFAIGCLVGIIAATLHRVAEDYLPTDWQFLTSESWSLLILGVVGLITSVVGALATEPTPEPVLRRFYLTTLPFGIWGRFKDQLPTELRHRVQAEHRRDISAVPFALMFQILMFLSPMLLLIHNWSAGLICLTLALFCFAGLYWIWLRYINLSDVIWRDSLKLLDEDIEPHPDI